MTGIFFPIRVAAPMAEVEVNFCGRNASPILGMLKKFRVKFSGKVRRDVMRLDNNVVEDPKKKYLSVP